MFQETNPNRRCSPVVRVEKMFEDIQSKLPGAPQFLLCLLPDRKNSDLYGMQNLTCSCNHCAFLSLEVFSLHLKFDFLKVHGRRRILLSLA